MGGFLFSFHFMVFSFPVTFSRTSFSLQKNFPISPKVFLLALPTMNSSFVVPNCPSKCPIWQQLFWLAIFWWVHNCNFCGCNFGCEHFTSACKIRQDYNCEHSLISLFCLVFFVHKWFSEGALENGLPRHTSQSINSQPGAPRPHFLANSGGFFVFSLLAWVCKAVSESWLDLQIFFKTRIFSMSNLLKPKIVSAITPLFGNSENLDYCGVSLDPHFSKVSDGGSILWNPASSNILGKLSCTYEQCVACGKKFSSDSIFHLSKFWKKSRFWDTGR